MPYTSEKSWYVYGDLAGGLLWDYYQLQGADNVLTCTVTLAAGKEYYFKISRILGAAESCFSSGSTMTRTTCTGADFTTDGENAALATTIAGNYVFTFDTLAKTLSVTYPDALAPEAINATSVPAENGDVMIQAYYWAHVDNTEEPWTSEFGPIQWTDLNAQAEELGEYFDLVWLAPSAVTKDYTGFLPQNYSNQSNVWGTESELRTLINNLHAAGSKVVADIVINHSSPTTGYYVWDDPFDFGQYGTYNPSLSWITKDDEIFISQNNDEYKRYDTNPPQNAGIWEEAGYPDVSGSPEYDEKTFTNGEGGPQEYWSYAEYNCVYSRDWAHKMKEVREMCRAYLTWMKEYMGYDGWRYDFAKGIHASHLDDYNHASNAYFSVAECFDGDYRKDVGVVLDAHNNTYVFDFPAKYNFMNDAIRYGVYTKLLGNATNTMLYNYKKNTVTFVDNHDTFRENYNICGTPNAIGDSAKVIMANAFILSMPGVPCVFYPHWYKYKEILKPIINARHVMGVHSESAVVDEAMDTWVPEVETETHYYKATITGKNGNIRLLLGPNSGYNICPEGYAPAYVGTGDVYVGVYYTAPYPPQMETVYFLDTEDWGAANAYMWHTPNAVINANWPGEAMKLEGTFNGHKLFSYTYDANNFTNIIFSNPSNDNVKTQDLTPHEGMCYKVNEDWGEGGWTALNQLSHTLNIADVKWSSLYLPLTVSIPDGLYGYYASAVAGDQVTLNLLPEAVIPANTGVLVWGPIGEHALNVVTDVDANFANLFRGTKEPTALSDITTEGIVYVLSKSQTQNALAPVFAQYTGETIPAAKAYLLVENAQNAPAEMHFVIRNSDDATNIAGIAEEAEVRKILLDGNILIIRDGHIYNTLGRIVK